MILDNSAFSLLSCQRKFQLRVLQGLTVPSKQGETAAEFGSAVHTGIELIDKGEDIDKIFARLFVEYPQANREKLIKAIGAIVTLPARNPVVTLSSGLPALEFKFNEPYVGTNHDLGGTIDRIEIDDDCLVIRDYKTAGDYTEDKARKKCEQYEMSFQLHFYLWCLRHFALLRPEHLDLIEQNKYRLEYTIIFFNIEPVKIKTVVVPKMPLEFLREEVSIIVQQNIRLINSIAAINEEGKRAPMTGLTVYQACTSCEFRRACQSAGTEEEDRILSRFEQKEYDPMTFR